jgi:CHAT domain-containing protein
MRGRVLLERVRGDSSNADAPPTIEQIRQSLPPKTLIVSYAVLTREVLAWVIDRTGVSMYRSPLDSNLERLTSQFTSALASRSAGSESGAAAEELYRLLIAPFSAKIDVETRLVIVPDKWLQFVPFAALFDPLTAQFLVQRVEIDVVPSVRLYERSARRYDSLRRILSPSVLAVGNPTFDPRVFSLPSLPGAEREARHIASIYERGHLLVGRQATKDAFLRNAVTSNVIHFAGHGVARSDAPLLSYLVLAADSGHTNAALTARELFQTQLPVTRLAVLSGCQTASGHLSETEGVSSLARAFFAAGVPAVVASLWVVDDEATAEFFEDFHQVLSTGEDPSAALRHTQLKWLAKDKNGWSHASTWAAFTLFGATTRDAPNKAEYGVPKLAK